MLVTLNMLQRYHSPVQKQRNWRVQRQKVKWEKHSDCYILYFPSKFSVAENRIVKIEKCLRLQTVFKKCTYITVVMKSFDPKTDLNHAHHSPARSGFCPVGQWRHSAPHSSVNVSHGRCSAINIMDGSLKLKIYTDSLKESKRSPHSWSNCSVSAEAWGKQSFLGFSRGGAAVKHMFCAR